MQSGESLEQFLEETLRRRSGEPRLAAAARVILALSEAAGRLSALIAKPSPGAALGATIGAANADGDAQKQLDVIAEEICSGALREAGVGPYLSEEQTNAAWLNTDGEVAVAIDPLDGSSNIEVNGIVGTIFSILPGGEPGSDPAASFMVSGRSQIAAGFFAYGPQTTLVVSVGEGVALFGLDREAGSFLLIDPAMRIPDGKGEYAINASNHRHWHEPVRRFIDDCLAGAGGPHGRDFNMRWAGALASDAYRVFVRGGLFLYPADSRRGYEQGRLRLLYEASPMAFLAEQAGGAATDGENPILDRLPARPHERSPLVLGPEGVVELVRRYHRGTPDHPANG